MKDVETVVSVIASHCDMTFIYELLLTSDLLIILGNIFIRMQKLPRRASMLTPVRLVESNLNWTYNVVTGPFGYIGLGISF